MSNAAEVQDETEDRYYTQVEAGDVRLFTLDQLDAAFNAELIHENTYVCLEGDSNWVTLAEVAGLGDEEEPVSAPQLIAAPVPQYGYATPRSVVPSAPYSVAPMVYPSLRPVVNDLSFDDDDMAMLAMRPKRRAGKVLAALTVVGLAALGFAVVQSGGVRLPNLSKLGINFGQASAASMSLSSLKAAEATKPTPVAVPAPEAVKPEPPKEEPKPVEATAAPKSDDKAIATKSTDGAAKKDDDRFSDDMKAALLNKDKKQATDQKHKKTARTAVATKHKAAGKPAKGSSGGFKSGGSAYDPLNGKL